MQDYFYSLVEHIGSLLKGSEVFTASFDGEDSEFVRFNQSEVRQAGSVTQRSLQLSLIDGQRHAQGDITLSGLPDTDRTRVKNLVETLRSMLPHLPEDPYLLYATEVHSSESIGRNQLPDGRQAISSILDRCRGQDLVGVFASGGIYAGFANSLGQHNWYTTHSFNLDWSLYHQQDKAVKSAYAGFTWNQDELDGRMDTAGQQLTVLSRTPRTIEPGKYRVYLSPVAIYDILGTVAWGGFGLKDHRTKQTSLIRMVEEGAELSPKISILENTADGVAPNFEAAGFIKPPKVSLIDGGCFRNCLASPRSAKEYNVPTNGASAWEMPQSLEMAGGVLPRQSVAEELGDGLYINNVWYLNYSDRQACRITGMTRFATFWVENGKVMAPVNVMRFDESIYRMLGPNLVDLTRERELILDPETYGGRSTQSGLLPGALVENFSLTL